jgi:surface polysaccharide O-acyltransferase-like enzyme
MAKKQYDFLNILKTVAIIMVVAYHYAQLITTSYSFSDDMSAIGLISRFLFNANSVCMPIFFMVNGALLCNKELDLKKHFKRVGHLFVLFLIWHLITLSCEIAFWHLDLSTWGLRALPAFFIDGSFTGALPGLKNTHFWFIPALIAVYAIFPLIKREFDKWREDSHKNYYLVVFMVFLILVLFLPSFLHTFAVAFPIFEGIQVPLASYSPVTGHAGIMLIYFILGGILMNKREEIKKRVPIALLVGLFFLGLTMIFAKWYFESRALQADWNVVFHSYGTLATLAMSSSLFCLAARLPELSLRKDSLSQRTSAFLAITGSYTLAIYYIHAIINHTILKSFLAIAPIGNILIVYGYAILLVIVLSYLCFFLCKFRPARFLLK